MTNYPGPQEALDWWESDCRNTDGGKPKKRGNFYYLCLQEPRLYFT